MGVTALVMAGGKGTRMESGKEKPLLRVGGKSLIEYVLDALRDDKKVDEIIVAVSEYTPKTASMVKRSSVKILKTPGKDFVSDVQYIIKKLKLDTVLTISADLPFIRSEVIDEVVERYEQCGKPALTVMVPLDTRKKLGLYTDYTLEANGRYLVPAGINMIDGKRINEAQLEEEIIVIPQEEIAVNVNRLEDLKIAKRLFKRK